MLELERDSASSSIGTAVRNGRAHECSCAPLPRVKFSKELFEVPRIEQVVLLTLRGKATWTVKSWLRFSCSWESCQICRVVSVVLSLTRSRNAAPFQQATTSSPSNRMKVAKVPLSRASERRARHRLGEPTHGLVVRWVSSSRARHSTCSPSRVCCCPWGHCGWPNGRQLGLRFCHC